VKPAAAVVTEEAKAEVPQEVTTDGTDKPTVA
jgi:hypothetical protein